MPLLSARMEVYAPDLHFKKQKFLQPVPHTKDVARVLPFNGGIGETTIIVDKCDTISLSVCVGGGG